MFSRHRVAGALSLLMAGMLTAACAAPGGDGGEGGADQVHIAFSHPTIFTTGLPYYVAKEKGFYRDANLGVDATYTGGGSETVQAVVSGSADIGTETSGPAAVGAFSQGAQIKIVSASTTGLDLMWFSKADGPIKTEEDLAGKKVGYSSTGSSSHVGVLALGDSLKNQGESAVRAEAIGSPPDNYTAVKTGQIAAGWTQPPFLLKEVENGELRFVAKGSDLGEYQDVAMRVVIANSQWAEQNPDTAKRFLEVQSKAWDWIFNNRQEAVKIWKNAANLEESEKTLMTTFDYYTRENLRLFPVGGRDAILNQAQQFGFVERPLNADQQKQLFDLSYQPESLK